MSSTGPPPSFQFFEILPLLLALLIFIVIPSQSQHIQRTRIGDTCDARFVCDSNNYLLTCHQNLRTADECRCNEKIAIQVDFLYYRVGRMCLLRGNVPCDRMLRFDQNFRDNIQKVPDILRRYLKTKPPPEADIRVIMEEEMEEIVEGLRKVYDKEPSATRPTWENYFDEHFTNYTRDATAYLVKYGGGTPCASGKCNGADNKCAEGVHTQHNITVNEGIGRDPTRDENSATSSQILSFKILLSIHLLIATLPYLN